MSFLPLVLVLLTQEPAPLAGTVVDRRGRPVAGLEIVLAWGQAVDGTVPILDRATTDPQGRYQIKAPVLNRRLAQSLAPFLMPLSAGIGAGRIRDPAEQGRRGRISPWPRHGWAADVHAPRR